MTHGIAPGLDFWEPKRLTSLADARDRVILIKRLRVAMIVLAAVALAALLISAVVMSIDRESRRPQKFEAEDIVRMVNPRFSGRTAKGEPYQVLAQSAMRRKGDPNIIDLVAPIMKDLDGSTLSSATGIYNTETKIIELTGKVKFLDPVKGLSVSTPAIPWCCWRKAGSMAGRGYPVRGRWDRSSRTRMKFATAGRKCLFTGGVRTRLTGRSAKPAASAPSWAIRGAVYVECASNRSGRHPSRRPWPVQAAPASAQIGKNGGPVDIESDQLQVIDAERKAVFSGNVDAQQGDARLKSRVLTVFFAQNAAAKSPARKRRAKRWAPVSAKSNA